MTIKQLFTDTCAKRGDAVALRYKEEGRWLELSYRELLARVRQVAGILGAMDIKPGDRVGIYLANCRQWPEIYFAIVGLGATAVPVDAGLRAGEVAHVLRDSGAVAVFASARNYTVLREAEGHVADLRHAVLLDGSRVLPVDVRAVSYSDYDEQMTAAASAGDAVAERFDAATPQDSDVASIIYTSGTTGRQKGAMLTHANFCSNVASALKAIELFEDDNFLLVLPLHHAFAFTTNLLIPVAVGGQISFIESLKTVGENTREVSPTVLAGVPLLLEKMYAKIWAGLRKKPLAYFLYKSGVRAPVVKGIRQKLGGKLRLAVVGGAPSSPDVLRGFARLGVNVLEGYGLTETGPVLTFNPQDDPRPGTVGTALPDVELKIMEPNAEGVGEIVARGPNIMPGYYNNPEATAAVFNDDWFLTGDLGFIDDDGYLTITGRKKSLIVNREGKNIYPEEVEGEVCRSPFVQEALVLGYVTPGETGERVGVIVVPDQEALDAYTAKQKQKLNDDAVTDLMKREVRKALAGLADYKRPRQIQVRTEEFEKTSTSKVKRYLYAIAPADV